MILQKGDERNWMTFGGKRYHQAASGRADEIARAAKDYRSMGYLARMTHRAHYSSLWVHNPKY
jgi:hypothetical protein